MLDTRSGWTVGGEQGAAVVPGNVDGSLLIKAVRYTDPDLQMPPDKPLPAKAIAALEQWVRSGAPDPRDKAVKPNGNSDPSDPIAGREHWAFRPLQSATVPKVKSSQWPLRSIDNFVLARLESKSLRPQPEADRRTLARRAYVQLIGLPPTPEQLAGFMQDDNADAFERLVDRLLDSSHFGERWGRHWLDLARYADSNGLDENFLFREAWRYRNWVIDAINADVPFDQFLTQQIAGDLLPHESIEQRDSQRIAAGFLVVGPKVLLGNDAKERNMDVADEQLDTIGKAILGQTLGCARCHDHKFDPIPTADYYALAGIMTSTTVMERRYMLGQQRVMEQLVGLGSDGHSADEAYEKYWRESAKLKEDAKQANAALELLKKKDKAGLKELAKKHSHVIAKEAATDDLTMEQRIDAQQKLVAKFTAAASPPGIPPRAMVPVDVDTPNNESIRLAGRFDNPGEEVPRGVLQVLTNTEIEIPKETSGRRELAHWLTDVENGAGRLAARVLANRIWHHLIGRGLVRTVDNFGRTGDVPSHPLLLDHLAQQLIDSNWSIKSLVREIVLSRTFRMSSQHDKSAHLVDPENRMLWRANKRRLSPEALRDAMLSAAGTLDLKPLDSTVSYLGDQATAVGANKNRRRTDFPNRSVYLPVIRNDLPEVFDVFDFADPHATTGMRPETMIATQGLFVLNDSMVMDAADATARLILKNAAEQSPVSMVGMMFKRILGKPPSDEERTELLAFISEIEKQFVSAGHKEPKIQAWAMACHALFASSRFQVLD